MYKTAAAAARLQSCTVPYHLSLLQTTPTTDIDSAVHYSENSHSTDTHTSYGIWLTDVTQSQGQVTGNQCVKEWEAALFIFQSEENCVWTMSEVEVENDYNSESGVNLRQNLPIPSGTAAAVPSYHLPRMNRDADLVSSISALVTEQDSDAAYENFLSCMHEAEIVKNNQRKVDNEFADSQKKQTIERGSRCDEKREGRVSQRFQYGEKRVQERFQYGEKRDSEAATNEGMVVDHVRLQNEERFVDNNEFSVSAQRKEDEWLKKEEIEQKNRSRFDEYCERRGTESFQSSDERLKDRFNYGERRKKERFQYGQRDNEGLDYREASGSRSRSRSPNRIQRSRASSSHSRQSCDNLNLSEADMMNHEHPKSIGGQLWMNLCKTPLMTSNKFWADTKAMMADRNAVQRVPNWKNLKGNAAEGTTSTFSSQKEQTGDEDA